MQGSKRLTPEKSALRTFLLIAGAFLVFLVYAFAVQETEINLEKPLDPGRQTTLLNVLRQLADPDIITVNSETGGRELSEAARITISRIIETILMALMASTLGTILAIPVSFLAARNLMEHVTAPLAAIMGGWLGLLAGAWLGMQVAGAAGSLAVVLSRTGWQSLGILLLIIGLAATIMRTGGPILSRDKRSRGATLLSSLRLLLVAGLAILGLALLAHVGIAFGLWLEGILDRLDLGLVGRFASVLPESSLGFLGYFVYILFDFLKLILPTMLAFLIGLLAASYGSRYAQELVIALRPTPGRLFTALVSAVGAFTLIYGLGSALNWLYQFDNPQNWTTIPAVIGAAATTVIALILKPKKPYPIGLTIYTISRAILNVLRSIEPLIMGIVFVVWVSLGPFAGIMALTLHSIAALGKLFSEQVEGISEGPVEAITATGANRIQTIVFAVIPQIVPPFIAFTLYRWDINVRMSTIIGFVGGGGIGFVLSQNIQQLRYRQASVMMLAIAIVVTLLDYVSSSIRRRII
jgi:phosphonate ABC transporter permease subunit PhnE